MRTRTVLAGAFAALVAVALVVVVPAGPASSQAEPCPPGQPPGRPPGTPPGPGSPPRQPPGRPPEYPPGKCQLRLSRSVVAAGESVVVAGDGFAPGAQVRVSAAGTTLQTLSADGSGSFSADVVIPAATPPGTYEVSAAGAGAGGGTQVLAASLTVTGAGSDHTGAGGESLPPTGAGDGVVPLALGGAALLGMGSAAVVGARRRRGSRPA